MAWKKLNYILVNKISLYYTNFFSSHINQIPNEFIFILFAILYVILFTILFVLLFIILFLYSFSAHTLLSLIQQMIQEYQKV